MSFVFVCVPDWLVSDHCQKRIPSTGAQVTWEWEAEQKCWQVLDSDVAGLDMLDEVSGFRFQGRLYNREGDVELSEGVRAD